MSADPERWTSPTSDAPPSMRELLDEARQVGPTRDEAARLLARVEASEGAVTAGGIGVAAAIAGAIALVAAGVWTLRSARPEDSLSMEVRPVAPPSAAPAAPEEVSLQPVVAPEAPKAPAAHGEKAEPAPAQASTRQPTSDGKVRGAPSAQPSEAALLYAARTQLSANPARAIELLERHRAEYPNGILAEERDALLVEALARAGKASAAARESEAFKAAHPDSAHRVQ